MSSMWYFSQDGKTKQGPFSQQQLKEFAAAGTILPIDMVWKEGVEQGVQANLVKNLFPRPVMTATSTEEIDKALAKQATEPSAAEPETPPPEKPAPTKTAPPAKPKKGRATAIKGCDVVSQDGTYARYRKKCTKCGHIDSACHTLVIANRRIKVQYFCPKCRKSRVVEIQCQVS